jgi:hypothetical protein
MRGAGACCCRLLHVPTSCPCLRRPCLAWATRAASQGGYTALHVAAQYGHTEAVNALLAAGANREAADKVRGYCAQRARAQADPCTHAWSPVELYRVIAWGVAEDVVCVAQACTAFALARDVDVRASFVGFFSCVR